MARFDFDALSGAAVTAENADGAIFFRLGLMYSSGHDVETDRVEAHKWFNLAASRGNEDAIQYREEVAREMSRDEVRAALRSAREWLTVH